MAVEDFTGVEIDHFAVFDFEGFKAIIDRVGGVEICVDYAGTRLPHHPPTSASRRAARWPTAP